MRAGLPLPSLLSQALVAFTIEFDNEYEHRMPHRTSRGPAAHSPRGPWLVSQAMWANFMQYVTAAGVPLRELSGLARITNLPGLERWGYVVVEPDPADRRARPPRSAWVVRPTAAGQRAQQVWRPLAGLIEQRWQARFGADHMGSLTARLQALVSQFSLELPCYLPVTGVSKQDLGAPLAAGRGGGGAAQPDLSVLLSQALLMFTIDFERESDLSLALSANVLRVLSAEGVRVRDLPLRAGVSKEAASLSVGFLERHGHIVVEPDPAASRTKLARLTPQGGRTLDAGRRLLGGIEERWRAQHGPDTVRALRESLLRLFDQPAGERPRISEGLAPHPDGWRAHPPYLTQTTAMIRDPAGTLPHHPMVSHRGGFPDGS